MLHVKKIICIITILLWIIHPCLAAHAHSATHKKKSVVHHRIHTKKKNHTIKSSSKKCHKSFHPKQRRAQQHLNKSHKNNSHLIIKKSKLTYKQHRPNIPTQSANTQQYQDLVDSVNNAQSDSIPKKGFVASIEQRLVDFVHRSIATLRYSAYKLGGSHFDTSHGIYIVDCSSYVDHTLRAVFPNAYLSLVNSTGTDKPNTLNFYNFFTGLSDESNEYWSKIEDVEKLQPGDILVFRYKNSRGNDTGGSGHIMFVMDKPIRDGDSFLISVADSAPVGHSEDTRSHRVSGIGIGTLVLKVDPETGEPSAYAWKVGSRWKNNVKFAMARPLDIDA